MADGFFSRFTSLHKKLLFIILAMVMVGALGYGAYRFMQLSSEISRLKASPQAAQDAAKSEIKKLVEQVSKLIAVPQDEAPTVATVSDSEKLKVNPFFSDAKNGDKVLIFTGAKKAILYRPDENKIIEVGPLTIGTASATTKEDPVRFVLYNGTNVTGFTKTYETTLKELVKAATVTDRDNAAKRNYATSMLIDLTGTHRAVAADVAKTLDLEVSSLPAGETKPTGADFLIILGEDKK